METEDEDPLDRQIDDLFERSDRKIFTIFNQIVEEIRMENERRQSLGEWLESAEQVADESDAQNRQAQEFIRRDEDEVWDRLQQSVEAGAITEDEALERMRHYHIGRAATDPNRTVPDIMGRDI